MINYTLKNTYNLTDLRRKTSRVIKTLNREREPVVLIDRSKPVAVLVDISSYEGMVSLLEDLADISTLKSAEGEKDLISWESVKNEL